MPNPKNSVYNIIIIKKNTSQRLLLNLILLVVKAHDNSQYFLQIETLFRFLTVI